MTLHEFVLFADHHQFYLQDEAAHGDWSEAWTPEASERLLAVAPGTLGIGTVRNMHVPVRLEVLGAEPAEDFEAWGHVVACSLAAPSGRIVVAGCMDYLPDAARVDVPAGGLRARVSYGALDSLSLDGLDGDDHYRVQLWPGGPVLVSVLKQRPSPAPA